MTLVLVCLFCTDSSFLFADQADTLSPLVGNPKVYSEMRAMMEEERIAHEQDLAPIVKEFIRQHDAKAKDLSIPSELNNKFMRFIDACDVREMYYKLKATLVAEGAKMRVITVDSEDDLPKFRGKTVWGYADEDVTVFALKTDSDRTIIARLAHEIRAKSTSAKDLFEKEFKRNPPATREGIVNFKKSLREKFERVNTDIEKEILEHGRIVSKTLRSEFVGLRFFAGKPQTMNRDYTMKQRTFKIEVTPEKTVWDDDDYKGPPLIKREDARAAITDFFLQKQCENTDTILKHLFGKTATVADIASIEAHSFQSGKFLEHYRVTIHLENGIVGTCVLAIPVRYVADDSMRDGYLNLQKYNTLYSDKIVKPVVFGTGNTGKNQLNIFCVEYLNDYIELNSLWYGKKHFDLNDAGRDGEDVARYDIAEDPTFYAHVLSEITKNIVAMIDYDEASGKIDYIDNLTTAAGDFMFKPMGNGRFLLKLITIRGIARKKSIKDFLDYLMDDSFIEVYSYDATFPVYEAVLEGVAQGLAEKYGFEKAEKIFEAWLKKYEAIYNKEYPELSCAGIWVKQGNYYRLSYPAYKYKHYELGRYVKESYLDEIKVIMTAVKIVRMKPFGEIAKNINTIRLEPRKMDEITYRVVYLPPAKKVPTPKDSTPSNVEILQDTRNPLDSSALLQTEIRERTHRALSRDPTPEEFAIIWQAHLAQAEGETGNIGEPDPDGIYRNSTLSPDTKQMKYNILAENNYFNKDQIKRLFDYGACGDEGKRKSHIWPFGGKSYGVFLNTDHRANNKLISITSRMVTRLQSFITPVLLWSQEKGLVKTDAVKPPKENRATKQGLDNYLDQQREIILQNIDRLEKALGHTVELALYEDSFIGGDIIPTMELSMGRSCYRLSGTASELISFRDHNGRIYMSLDFFVPGPDPEMQHELAVEAAMAALAEEHKTLKEDLQKHTRKILTNSSLFAFPHQDLEREIPTNQIMPLLYSIDDFEGAWNIIIHDDRMKARTISPANEEAAKIVLLEKLAFYFTFATLMDSDKLLDFLRAWLPLRVTARGDLPQTIRDYVKYGKATGLQSLGIDDLRTACRHLVFMGDHGIMASLARMAEPDYATKLLGNMYEDDWKILAEFKYDYKAPDQMINDILSNHDVILIQSEREHFPQAISMIEGINNLPKNTLLSFPLVDREGLEMTALWTFFIRDGTASWKEMAQASNEYIRQGNPQVLYVLDTRRPKEHFNEIIAHLNRFREINQRSGLNQHYFPAFQLHSFTKISDAKQLESYFRQYLGDIKSYMAEAGLSKAVLIEILPMYVTFEPMASIQKPSRNAPDLLQTLLKSEEFFGSSGTSAVHVTYDMRMDDFGPLFKAFGHWPYGNFGSPINSLIAPMPVSTLPQPGERYVFGNFDYGLFTLIKRPDKGKDHTAEPTPKPSEAIKTHTPQNMPTRSLVRTTKETEYAPVGAKFMFTPEDRLPKPEKVPAASGGVAKAREFAQKLLEWVKLPDDERTKSEFQPVWSSDNGKLGQKNERGETITLTPEVVVICYCVLGDKGDLPHRLIILEAIRKTAGILSNCEEWKMLRTFLTNPGVGFPQMKALISDNDRKERFLATCREYLDAAIPVMSEGEAYMRSLAEPMRSNDLWSKVTGLGIAEALAAIDGFISMDEIHILYGKLSASRYMGAAFGILRYQKDVPPAVEYYKAALKRKPDCTSEIARRLAELALSEEGKREAADGKTLTMLAEEVAVGLGEPVLGEFKRITAASGGVAEEAVTATLEDKFVKGSIFEPKFIEEERKRSAECKTVAFDLDGTLITDKDELITGIEEELRQLKHAGLRLVIWTSGSKQHVEQVFYAIPNLALYFDCVITGENYYRASKNDRELWMRHYTGFTGEKELTDFMRRLDRKKADPNDNRLIAWDRGTAYYQNDEPAPKDVSLLGYSALVDDSPLCPDWGQNSPSGQFIGYRVNTIDMIHGLAQRLLPLLGLTVLEKGAELQSAASASLAASHYSTTGVREILDELHKVLPEWFDNPLETAEFIKELSRLLEWPEDAIGEKSTLLFSEGVTFKAGLGLLLEKVARSNPNRTIAVIVNPNNAQERAFIDELNRGKPKDQWIVTVESVRDAWTRLKGRKTYYFKMKGDPEPDFLNDNIIVRDITDIVKKIIDALGTLSGIVEDNKLRLLHDAVQKFSEAA